MSKEILAALIGIGGVVLGFVCSEVTKWVRNRAMQKHRAQAKEREKIQAAKELDELSFEVLAAIRVTPHGVQNKDNWIDRLQKFSEQNRNWLGRDLTFSVEKTAWRIKDNRFIYEEGKPPYCCNELTSDLLLLKLAILSLISEAMQWDSKELKRKEKEQMRLVWRSFQGPLFDRPGETIEAREADQTEQWHNEWKHGKFKVGEYLAMASYINARGGRS